MSRPGLKADRALPQPQAPRRVLCASSRFRTISTGLSPKSPGETGSLACTGATGAGATGASGDERANSGAGFWVFNCVIPDSGKDEGITDPRTSSAF